MQVNTVLNFSIVCSRNILSNRHVECILEVSIFARIGVLVSLSLRTVKTKWEVTKEFWEVLAPAVFPVRQVVNVN